MHTVVITTHAQDDSPYASGATHMHTRTVLAAVLGWRTRVECDVCVSIFMFENPHVRQRNATLHSITAVSGSCWGAATASVITFPTYRSLCAFSGRHLRLQPQICPRILAPCHETRRFRPPVLEYRYPNDRSCVEFHGGSAAQPCDTL